MHGLRLNAATAVPPGGEPFPTVMGLPVSAGLSGVGSPRWHTGPSRKQKPWTLPDFLKVFPGWSLWHPELASLRAHSAPVSCGMPPVPILSSMIAPGTFPKTASAMASLFHTPRRLLAVLCRQAECSVRAKGRPPTLPTSCPRRIWGSVIPSSQCHSSATSIQVSSCASHKTHLGRCSLCKACPFLP